MKLSVYSKNNKYFFVLGHKNKNIFNSSINYYLSYGIKSSYDKIRDAHYDAIKMCSRNPIFIDYLTKNAQNAIEQIDEDISAEEMIMDKYSNLYMSFKKRMKGCKEDEKEEKKVKEELKMILKELSVLKKINTEEKDVKKIQSLLEKFEKTQEINFPDDFEEYQKQKAMEENAAANDMSIPSMPQDPSMQPQEAMQPAMPEMPGLAPTSSNFLKNLIVMSQEESLENTRKFDTNEVEDILSQYAKDACNSLDYIDTNTIFSVNPEDRIIKIYSVKDGNKKHIITISVNEDLFVEGVFPGEFLRDFVSLNSLEFYQKYWKRIIESIGHYCLKNKDLVMIVNSSLPDIPNGDKVFQVNAWSIRNFIDKPLDLTFCSNKSDESGSQEDMWYIKPSSESKKMVVASSSVSDKGKKYLEQKYIDQIVKCIDKNLDKLYNRTGTIEKIIPQSDCVFLHVNFGRGLGTIMLMDSLDGSKKQIEIVEV